MFHGNTPTLQTILQLQNVDSSIKIRRRLPPRPAPLARVDPAHATAPLKSSWDVLCLHQISAQSLEAMAVITHESAGRISQSCMHVACRFTGGVGHCALPIDRVDLVSCHNLPLTLLYLWTQGSLIWRPSPHTARCGMRSVPLFCKFHRLGGDCF